LPILGSFLGSKNDPFFDPLFFDLKIQKWAFLPIIAKNSKNHHFTSFLLKWSKMVKIEIKHSKTFFLTLFRLKRTKKLKMA
jgi:hypothetical protein